MAITLIVEDGTGVANANTYVDDTTLIAFASDRGVTMNSTQAKAALIRAMDYLETLSYNGMKYESAQSLQFPRSYLYLDGYLIDNDVIPNDLKKAQMLLAIEIFNGNDPSAPITRTVEGVKVGPIDIKYSANAALTTMTPAVSNVLRKLLGNGGDGFEIDVIRDDPYDWNY